MIPVCAHSANGKLTHVNCAAAIGLFSSPMPSLPAMSIARPSGPWLAALGLLAIAFAAFAWTPWGFGIEESAGLRTLFLLRGERPAEPAVVIVALRKQATARVWMSRRSRGQSPCDGLVIADRSPGPEWMNPPPPSRLATWPRCLHARLVEALDRSGARAIVFDVLFRPRDQALLGFDVAEDDAALARAFRNSRKVVIAQKLEVVGREEDGTAAVELASLSEVLEHAAYAAAPFPLPGSRDDEVRRAWLFLETTPPLPTFPTMTLHGLVTGFGSSPRPAGTAGGESLADASALHASIAANPGLKAALLAHARGDGHPDSERAARRAAELWGGPELRWINFYGGPEALPTEGFDRVIAGDAEALARIAGRTVFVGYAENLQAEPQDDHATVFSREGRNMHGVEIAATTFANMMDGSFVRPASPAVSAAIAGTAFLFAAWITWLAAPALGLVLVAALAAAYLFGAVTIFGRSYLWMPVIVPLALSMPVGWLAITVHQYRAATLQRKRLSDVFANVVPAEIVRQLGDNAQSLRSIRRDLDAACLATDAHQYTALAERMRSAAVFEFLNRYYEPLFSAVAQQGGFVSDVVGDSMLAIWPARAPSQDPRIRVCEACLDIVNGADRLMREDPSVGLLTRIGVSWGSVTLGFVGSVGHYEYRAVGDPVNAANRLQSLAGTLGVRVAVSAEFADGISGFVWRDLGDFLLKGRTTPTRVLELVGRTEELGAELRSSVERFNAAMASLRIGDSGAADEALSGLQADGPVRFWRTRISEAGGHATMPVAMGREERAA